jgi:hypothetical protein
MVMSVLVFSLVFRLYTTPLFCSPLLGCIFTHTYLRNFIVNTLFITCLCSSCAETRLLIIYLPLKKNNNNNNNNNNNDNNNNIYYIKHFKILYQVETSSTLMKYIGSVMGTCMHWTW